MHRRRQPGAYRGVVEALVASASGFLAKRRNARRHRREAYDLWDRFQHKDALNRLLGVEKSENDLAAVLGQDRCGRLLAQVRQHRELLDKIAKQAPGPTPERTADLLANARRCRDRGRYDDAVARLYRAIEAIAQCKLAIDHGIADTGHVPLEHVPDELRQEWNSRADNGKILMGLQDDYELLTALGDPLGATFRDLSLHDRERSALTARNQSILAHGFDPVSQKIFDRLWEASLRLSGVAENDLVQFPMLTNTSP